MSETRTRMKPQRRSSQVSDSSTSSESTSSFSSEDEEADARDLKPIKDYLNDRRELASQLFKSVKLEKIRMMLPQALKKINLHDLEEFCGSELSGMSRKRIISIINGQRMAESSDTDETDDSGPSLEIISDTEEWLTDDEVVVKEENSSSAKSKPKKNTDKLKKKSRPLPKDKVKLKPKLITNPGKDNKSANMNIKVEGEKTEPKEGESLLDLLELEMRARAIRALIRKEEDIIPNKTTAGTSSAKTGSNAAVKANLSGNKYVVQEMEQINVTLKQGSGLDDDVMLVIQPAPTIELLSSESENENEKVKDNKDENKRVNQRLENERETVKKGENKDVDEKLQSEGENDEEEQSKRVNKRLENECGTGTTHSTNSTIGDEVVGVQDDESKLEKKSPPNCERIETEPAMQVTENVQKSPEKIEETDKVMDKSPQKALDESSDETMNKTSDKSVENTLESEVYKTAHKKEDEQEKNQGEVEKTSRERKTIDESDRTVEPEKAADSLRKQNSPEKELEEGELSSGSDLKEGEVVDIDAKKHSLIKRSKKRIHTRSNICESPEESEVSDNVTNVSEEKHNSRKTIRDSIQDTKGISSNELVNKSEKSKNYTVESSVKEEVPKEEEAQSEVVEQKKEQEIENELERKQREIDKTDMEEIIDLDDYPDDMDDLECNLQSTSNDQKKSAENDQTALVSNSEKTQPAETWASRYYNTDDVQNVIKESKIQSEIRKRLRERQRMSKLNNSPNTNTTESNSPVDIKVEEAKQKPLGSVEEYLALKAATVATLETSLDKKKHILSEKSKKSHKKIDSSRKNKTHISKKRLKSDEKNCQ